MESKVEKLEGLDAENEELRVANNDLMLQIQKRDADIDMREAAIEEAVAMICDLEARIEELKQQLLNSTQGKADQTTLPSQRVIVDSLSTPPQILKEAINGNSLRSQIPDDSVHSDAIPRIPSRSPLRQPSFLRNPKRSTVALRSLYSSANPSFISLKRPSSVFTDAEFDEEMERQMLNSPRLSILSESGFSSIYGHPRDQTASPAQSQSPSAANDQASHSPAWRAAHHEARIKDWVEESNRHERPETPVRKSLHPTASGHISSISQVLEEFPSDPSQQPARSPSSPRSASSNAQQRSEKVFLDRRSPTKSLRQSARAHHKLSLGSGPVFCSNHLPPTPDTMSTATTGGNSSMQSIIIEKSLADGSAAPPNGYAALVQHHPSPPSSNEVAVTDEIVIHNDMAPETSDDEMESIKVERSDIGSQGNDIGYAESPLHMGASMKATQFFGSDMPARPALTTYRSDIMFNGEGFSPKRPSRGSSYPSPADSGQHASKHVSPSRSSKRSSGVPSERTVTSPRLSSPSHPRSSSVLQPTTQDVDVQIKLNEKSHRASSSLRFRLPRVSSTANAPQSQSIGSRIFRRTNSQVSNSPDTKGSSPVQTKPSFRPHLPRPSSLYGQGPSSSSSSSSSPNLRSMLPTGMLTDLSKYQLHVQGRPTAHMQMK